MTKKMLIDASHPEETRVVIVDGNRVEELDFESRHKRQIRGNVYLARVTRVEPSLQAAFIVAATATAFSPLAKFIRIIIKSLMKINSHCSRPKKLKTKLLRKKMKLTTMRPKTKPMKTSTLMLMTLMMKMTKKSLKNRSK